MRQPVAALTADVHLCENVPACRAETPDEWFHVMGGYLGQLKEIAGNLPVIVAGDLFDRWNPSPRLINFAIQHLPVCFAVSGQHDQKHHQLVSLNETAYWTLVEAGKLVNLIPGGKRVGDVRAFGFHWGVAVGHCPDTSRALTKLAVVHKYLWVPGCEHLGASSSDALANNVKSFRGYDAVVIGDNHKHWAWNLNKAQGLSPAVFNPGTFVRRKADEITHKPSVGVLHDDGTIEIHWLDTSGDRFVEAPERAEAVGLDSAEFLKELLNLADASIDYRDAVRRFMKTNATKEEVREFVTRLMEDKNRG